METPHDILKRFQEENEHNTLNNTGKISPDALLSAIQSGEVREAVNAQAVGNNNGMLTDLLGGGVIGLGNMLNSTIYGGTAHLLRNLGNAWESISPFSGQPDVDYNELLRAGIPLEEINRRHPYENSWITSLGNDVLGAGAYFSNALDNLNNQWLGQNTSRTAKIGQGTGSSLGYALPAWAVTLLSGGNPILGALTEAGLEALSEAGGFLIDAYKQGKADNNALSIANKNFLANLALNSVLNNTIGRFSPIAQRIQNPLGRWLTGSALEVLNENIQEPSQNIIEQASMKSLENPNSSFTDNLFNENTLSDWLKAAKELAPEVTGSTLLTQGLLGLGEYGLHRYHNYRNGQALASHKPYADNYSEKSGNDNKNTNLIPDSLADTLGNLTRNYDTKLHEEADSSQSPENIQGFRNINDFLNDVSKNTERNSSKLNSEGQYIDDLVAKENERFSTPTAEHNDEQNTPPHDTATPPNKLNDSQFSPPPPPKSSFEHIQSVSTLENNSARTGSNTTRIRTMRGTEVEARYRIVDVNDLIASTKDTGAPNPYYPQELQPRDRSRDASYEQIDKIARNIDPEMIGENRLASDGAPVIGPDLVVESGNARVLAIRKAYNLGKAEHYRQWLKDNAAYFGLDPDGIDSINHPVLVRERISDVDRVKFTSEANEASTAQMSATEHAFDDAKKITDSILMAYDSDKPITGNLNVVMAFTGLLPQNERGDLRQKDGRVSKAAIERFENALLVKAYNDATILDRLNEQYDDNAKNISTAIKNAAPKIALLENGLHRKDLSIRNDIVQAVQTLARIRSEGQTVDEYLNQLNLFDDISNEAKRLLLFFDRHKRGHKAITEMLAFYSDYAMNQGRDNDAQAVLPGLEDSIQHDSKMSLLKKAMRDVDAAFKPDERLIQNNLTAIQNNDGNNNIYSRNFKEWSGDWENEPQNSSKVVDDFGRPLVVYHGTDAIPQNGEEFPFSIFDVQGKNQGETNTEGTGAWFHSNRKAAKTFGDFVYEVYLDIKKPYVVSVNKNNQQQILRKKEQIVRDVKDGKYGQGYDGVIFSNIEDVKHYFDATSADDVMGDVYVVFRPEQVKSATHNNGNFSTNEQNIFRQSSNSQNSSAERVRLDFKQQAINAGRSEQEAEYLSQIFIAGAKFFSNYAGMSIEDYYRSKNFSFIYDDNPAQRDNRGNSEFIPRINDGNGNIIQDEQNIIRMFQNANASTPIHEFGHFFLKEMRDLFAAGKLRGQALQDWITLTRWLGIDEIDFSSRLNDSQRALFRDAHEKLATAFEKYVMTGKAPNSALKKAFEAFKRWLSAIYNAVRNIRYLGSDGRMHSFSLSPDVTAVFDRILNSDHQQASLNDYETDSEYGTSYHDNEAYAQNVKHGSGAIFKDKKFDLSKASYGKGGIDEVWGAHFSDDEAVAAKFRGKGLPNNGKGNVHVKYAATEFQSPMNMKSAWNGPSLDDVKSEVLDDIKYALIQYPGIKTESVKRDLRRAYEEALKRIKDTKQKKRIHQKISFLFGIRDINLSDVQNGNIYDFDIPEDDSLLDFNSPIKNQSPKIIEAVHSVMNALNNWNVPLKGRRDGTIWFGDVETGRSFYTVVVNAMKKYMQNNTFTHEKYGVVNDPRMAASLLLDSFGIKGIFTKGIGTGKGRNFVVFNEDSATFLGVQGDAENYYRQIDAQIEAQSKAQNVTQNDIQNDAQNTIPLDNVSEDYSEPSTAQSSEKNASEQNDYKTPASTPVTEANPTNEPASTTVPPSEKHYDSFNDNVSVALELLNRGRTHEVISMATGLVQDNNGKWVKKKLEGTFKNRNKLERGYRRELQRLTDKAAVRDEHGFIIDIDRSKLSPNEQYKFDFIHRKMFDTALMEAIDDEALFNAYPQLRNVKYSEAMLPKGVKSMTGLDNGEYRITVNSRLNSKNAYAALYEGIQRVIQNIEGLTQIGTQSDENAAQSESYNQFIGVPAAKRLDYEQGVTWRLDNYNIARNMERSGIHPHNIWLATGWGRGVDGKWRTEEVDGKLNERERKRVKNLYDYIQDRENKLKYDPDSLDPEQKSYLNSAKLEHEHVRLHSLLNFPELFDAYPQLRNVTVIETALDTRIAGSSNGKDRILINTSLNNDEYHSTLLHETQHIIQSIEGFARGGNDKIFEKLSRTLGGNGDFLYANPYLSKSFKRRAEALYRAASPKLRKKFQELRKKQHSMSQSDFDALVSQSLSHDEENNFRAFNDMANSAKNHSSGNVEISHITPMELYRHTAGEVEAENTVRRKNMSLDERRLNPPDTTESVPREEQFIVDAQGEPLRTRNSFNGNEEYNQPVISQRDFNLDDTHDNFVDDSLVERYNQTIGIGGAKRLDEQENATWRMDNLKIARKMERAKSDSKAIWAATGWIRGADGKWRMEIPDGKIIRRKINEIRKLSNEVETIHNKLKNNPNYVTSRDEQSRLDALGNIELQDFFDAPELFNAYPDARNISVDFDDLTHGNSARYDPIRDIITINQNIHDNRHLRLALIHEIQHAVQVREGFAVGFGYNIKNDSQFKKAQRKFERALSKLDKPSTDRVLEALNAEFIQNDSVKASSMVAQLNPDELNAYNIAREPASIIKSRRDTLFSRYKRHAGETEARNSEKRAYWNEDRRKRTPLDKSEDVPRNEQIIGRPFPKKLTSASTESYNQIIGEKGAAALDKQEGVTTRIDALRIAKQMTQKHLSKKLIRAATNWELGTDGKWKYEILDGKIIQDNLQKLWDTYQKNGKAELYLSDVFESNELFYAYPDFENYTVRIDTLPENVYMEVNNDTVTFNPNIFSKKNIHNWQKIQSDLIHEIQHFIQHKEGFAVGTGISANLQDSRHSLINDIMKLHSPYQNIMLKIIQAVDNDNFSLLNQYMRILPHREKSLINKIIREYSSFYKANKEYINSAGETEARNSQTREYMTPEQRMYTLLEDTEDVPRSKQIVQFDESESYNQIIGEDGARAIDASNGNNDLIDNLNVAMNMADAGKDAKTIRLATGWEFGVDNEWKFELPDGQIRSEFLKDNALSANTSDTYRLENVFEAKDIFKAYPELKGYHVHFIEDDKLPPDRKAIFFPQDKQFLFALGLHNNHARRAIVHEIQHAIQNIEGFALPISPEEAADFADSSGYIDSGKLNWERFDRQANSIWEALSPSQQDLWESLESQIDDEFNGDLRFEDDIKQDILSEFLDDDEQELFLQWLKYKQNALEGRDFGGERISPFVTYWRSSGEVEARNSEHRLNMSDEKRRNSLLNETEDVNRDKQIVVKHDDNGNEVYSQPFLRAKKIDDYIDDAVLRADELSPISQKQFDMVKRQYQGTSQWLKAPNGKHTNLTERQWILVRTPNFKHWFGDWEHHPETASKVLDANGEPLVVYHGFFNPDSVHKPFSVFDTTGKGNSSNTGAWFTSSLDNAYEYVSDSSHDQDEDIYPVFLNIRNPYSVKGKKQIWNNINGKSTNQIVREVWNGTLGKKNHDGVIFHDIRDPDILSDIFVVPEKSNIKSASRNNGNFDSRNSDIYYQIGPRRKSEMDKALQQQRPDLNQKQRTEAINEIEKLGEAVREGGHPKVEKLATHWLLHGHVILPEDNYKIINAIRICEQHHLDPMRFDDPNVILAQYTIKETKADRRINPDNVKEFSHRVDYDEGISVYNVDDSPEGQEAVRNIIDTHWGEDANPWCLAARDEDGNLYDAWDYWNSYEAIPKRIAFQNGKLLAFCASNDGNITWWNREDKPSSGIPLTIKKHGFTYEYSYNEDNRKSVKLRQTLPDGTKRSWYENGQLQEERLPDGTTHAFYENGQLKFEYLPGGTQRTWYENGQLQIEMLPDGNIHAFYENGQLEREELPDGTRREWYKNGQLHEETLHDGTMRSFYRKGQLEFERLPDGTENLFYENGSKHAEKLLDGTQHWFYENGNLKIERLPNGTERRFNKNGNLVNETVYDREIYSQTSKERDFVSSIHDDFITPENKNIYYQRGISKKKQNNEANQQQLSFNLPDFMRNQQVFIDTPQKNSRRSKHKKHDISDDDFWRYGPPEAKQIDINFPEDQIEDVRQRYQNTPQWLKAPNGRPTNLTERQWLQVRTPNFKKWFGEWEYDPDNASKVVDENGEPLVVYHGSGRGNAVFFYVGQSGAIFSTSKQGVSFSYSGTDDEAHNYPIFLNIRNPHIIDAHGKGWASLDNDEGSTDDTVQAVLNGKYGQGHDGVIFRNIKDLGPYMRNQFVQNSLNGNPFSDVFAIFNDRQPKSATRNNGEFGTLTNDIYHQPIGNPREYLRNWLKGIAGSARNIFSSASAKNENNHTYDNLRFENEDTENRYIESRKGVKKQGVIQRIKNSTLSMLKSLRGDFPELSGSDAAQKGLLFAKEQFRLLHRKRFATVHEAMSSFTRNLRGLSEQQKDLFARKRLLDDLMWRKQNYPDAELPFGFNDDMLQREYKRFSELIQQDSKVADAIKAEEDTLSEISGEFVKLAGQLGLNLDDVLRNPHYYRHTILEYANAAAMGNGKRNPRYNDSSLQQLVDSELGKITRRDYLKRFKGSPLDINTDYIQANGEVRAQMLTDIQVMKTLLEIKKKYDIAPKLRGKLQKLFAEHKPEANSETHSQSDSDISISDVIPEGYSIWNPAGSRLISSANSPSENLISMALDDASHESGVPLDKIFSVLGDFGEHAINNLCVIPSEVAEALSKMGKNRERGMLGDAAKFLTNVWKKIVLFSPTRNLKYNFRNFTGDLDAVISGNPKALRFFGRAVKELTDYYRNRNATQDLQDYIQRSGGMRIESMNLDNEGFNKLQKISERTSFLQDLSLKNMPADAWSLIRDFFSREQDFTAWREHLLRYAAYLSYKQDMDSNNGTPLTWGASIPDEVMNVEDIRDRAYKMSNELLGAYDQISDTGKQLRDMLIPFWSWSEVNMRRYYRLLKNGLSGRNSSDFAKRFLLAKSARIPFYALSAAETFAKISLLTIAAQMFNRFIMGDDDDELPPDVKYKPHITLGKYNGQVYYFDRIGALGDAADWLALDSLFLDAKEFRNGQLSMNDYMKKVALAPVGKFLNSVNPLVRMPYELTLGRTLYPDPSHPRNINDSKKFIAQSLGLLWPYKAITNEPHNNWEEFKKLFIYSADADEAAYFYTLDKVREFQERVLGRSFNGYANTKRGQVLQKLKTALRLNDPQTVRDCIKEYMKLGGNDNGLKTSIKSMNPLHGLNELEQKQFIRWLDDEDKKYFKRADKFFHHLTDRFLR